MNENSVVLIDRTPADADDSAAVAYMFRRLDDRIESASEGWFEGPPDEALKSLLDLRYGTLGHIEKKAGETTLQAVKAAVRGQRSPIFADWNAYAIDWDGDREQKAIEWFQQHLKDNWPPEVEFLAEDLPTLYAACRAMDLAPVRQKPILDDPFPAAPILITGPTGSGKELLAKAIHIKSGRVPSSSVKSARAASGPPGLGALNCGGLPTELLESELFGHAKGAFTGAVLAKTGFVEEYKDGTLFLDEIGDMPASVQVRLLRFLNNGEFRPVGSNRTKQATPRIISATHVDLEAKVEKREFREDLFFRVRGERIRLRGLNERPWMARYRLIVRFLEVESARRQYERPTLTRRLWRALITYHWPGNLRELRYLVEQLLSEHKTAVVLDLENVNPEIVRFYREHTPLAQQDVLAALSAKERGDSAASEVVLLEGLKNRLEEERKNTKTRTATLKRAAALLRQLTTNLGLEDQLSHQVKALDLAAQQSVYREFKESWLSPIEREAEKQGLNAERVTKHWQAELDRVMEPLEQELNELGSNLAKARDTYGISAAFAILVRAAETGALPHAEKVLTFLNMVTEISGAPPMNEGLRAIADKLKNLSPAQLKSEFQSMLKAPVPAERTEDAEDDPESELQPKWEWKQVKKDPKALAACIERCGSVKAAAAKLGVTQETISRTRTRLGLERNPEKGDDDVAAQSH